MNIEVTAPIAAKPDLVWSVLCELERWPEWTQSITRVERLGTGPFAVGSRVRIKQPGMPPVVWQVTELIAGKSFTWEARNAGLLSVAEHEIGAGATPDQCRITLRFVQTGFFAPLLTLLAGSKPSRFVNMEAAGLKRRCEERSASARVVA